MGGRQRKCIPRQDKSSNRTNPDLSDSVVVKGLEAKITSQLKRVAQKARRLGNQKVYILDTNVYGKNGFAPYIFCGMEIPDDERKDVYARTWTEGKKKYGTDAPNGLCLASVVQEELDYLKSDTTISHPTRQAMIHVTKVHERFLLQEKGKRDENTVYDGIELNNHSVYFKVNFLRSFIPPGLRDTNISPDVKIVSVAKKVSDVFKTEEVQVVFVSDDVDARSRAIEMGLQAAPFLYESTDTSHLYEGKLELEVNPEVIEQFREANCVHTDVLKDHPLYRHFHPNMRLDLRDCNNNRVTGFLDRNKVNLNGYRFVDEAREPIIIKKPEAEVIEYTAEGLASLEGRVRIFQDSVKAKGQKRQLKGVIDKLKDASVEYPQVAMEILSGTVGLIRNMEIPYEPEKIQKVIEYVTGFKKACQGKKSMRQIVELESQLPLPMPYEPNVEQRPMLELMLNPDIGLVSVIGEAGTGKTFWSIYAALVCLQKGLYRKIMYIPPTEPMGGEGGLGFMPGTMDKKMAHFIEPVMDSAEDFVGGEGKSGKNTLGSYMKHAITTGKFVFKSPDYIRGRTLHDTFVIIDESHNYTPQRGKVIGSRAGRGSKYIILGDPGQTQAEERYVTRDWNMFVRAVDRFPGEPWYAHAVLTIVERSEVADGFARHF